MGGFGGVFLLSSVDFFYNSVDLGVFVIGLNQVSSCFRYEIVILKFFDIDTELDLDRLTNTGFHGTFQKGVVYNQGALTLPATWFCPLL